MYCVRCGVKLADTEKKCPLCETVVCHPDFQQEPDRLVYPNQKMPKSASQTNALNGAVLILFLIPLLSCFLADLWLDGTMEWFGYVAGAMAVVYVVFLLPMWFRKSHPAVFVPCDFAAAAAYLLYIDLMTGGNWFLSFAFPVVGALCLITSTVVILVYYVRRGKLYIFGGAFLALGGLMVLMEYLMKLTFGLPIIGWSVYPLAVFVLVGAMLLYLAINGAAREVVSRKFFF